MGSICLEEGVQRHFLVLTPNFFLLWWFKPKPTDLSPALLFPSVQNSAQQHVFPFVLPKYTASSTSHPSSTADPRDSVPASLVWAIQRLLTRLLLTLTPAYALCGPLTLTPACALSPWHLLPAKSLSTFHLEQALDVGPANPSLPPFLFQVWRSPYFLLSRCFLCIHGPCIGTSLGFCCFIFVPTTKCFWSSIACNCAQMHYCRRSPLTASKMVSWRVLSFLFSDGPFHELHLFYAILMHLSSVSATGRQTPQGRTWSFLLPTVRVVIDREVTQNTSVEWVNGFIFSLSSSEDDFGTEGPHESYGQEGQ